MKNPLKIHTNTTAITITDENLKTEKVDIYTDIPTITIPAEGENFIYKAGATNLELTTSGISGFLWLDLYKRGFSLRSWILHKIKYVFIQNPYKQDIIVHEGVKYQLVWRIWSGSYSTHMLTDEGSNQNEAIGRLKATLVNRVRVLIPGNLLTKLYGPIITALNNKYEKIANF